jgi:hypothetical protein
MKDGRIFSTIALFSRGRILGRNWDKSLTSFPPCYSQSPLLTDFTSPTPWSEVARNILYGNLNSQRNCAFMNSASGFLISTNHNKTSFFWSHCAFPSQRTTKTWAIRLLLLQRCYCADDYSDVVALELIQLPSLLLLCYCVAYYELLLLWCGAL